MWKFAKATLLSLCMLILSACNLPQSAAQPTPTSPTQAASQSTSTPTVEVFQVAEPCTLIPSSEITAYLRPSTQAEVFDILPSGMQVIVEAQTADGWVGFSPGIPQAANVGVFRQRWVQESSAFQLEGACEDIPVVKGPPPGVCFIMAETQIPIYAETDPSAEVIAELHSEDYAQVLSKFGDVWYELDLSVGSEEMDLTGWISSEWANFNGRCSFLFIETPSGSPIVHFQFGDMFSISAIHMATNVTGWAIGHGVGIEDHILRTTDGGTTWQDVTPLEPTPSTDMHTKSAVGAFLSEDVARIAYYFDEPPFPTQNISFWSTQDGGISWTSGGVMEIDLSEKPPVVDFVDVGFGWVLNEFFIGAGHRGFRLFQTMDGGKFYSQILAPPDTESSRYVTGMDFGDVATGWMTIESPFEQAEGISFDKTTDGGWTWTPQVLIPPYQMPELFQVSAFCRTTSPTLFSALEGNLVLECTQETDDGDLLRRFLYVTSDGGETWWMSLIPAGDLLFLNSMEGFALGRDIYWTEDGGGSWTKIKSVSWEGQFSFISTQIGWAVARSEAEIALVKTVDGGRTWQILEPQIAEGGASSVSEPCMITATDPVTIYMRPSLQAEVLASMVGVGHVRATARTADGWIGFDPVEAQAANMGVFRHRWIQESNALRYEGACDALPVVVGPAPGVCFLMPMFDVPIYVEPDISSTLLITLNWDDYAEVEGKTEDSWYAIDLSVGNVGKNLKGWMEGIHANFNGPCWDLPLVTP